VLFGSRARGDQDRGSDYDFLVLLKGGVDPRKERQEVGELVYDLCWKYDVVIVCHVVSLERYRSEDSPFMMNVRREGIAV